MHDNIRNDELGASDTPLPVLLVAPDDLVTESIRRALDHEPQLTVVGRVDGDGAVGNLVGRHPNAVAVVTAHVDDAAGLTYAARLRDQRPELPVVVLADTASGPALVSALAAGCSGFVAWDGSFSDLVLAVQTAATGGVHVPRAMAADLAAHLQPERRSLYDLTERELEVLGLLARGMSTDEMVDELCVSVHTVRNHVRAILAKLGAHSRLEAVAIATRRGLVPTPKAPALR